MSIYSGKNASALDLIAKHSVTKKDIELIYDEVAPTIIGELKFVSSFESLSDLGLVRSGGVWSWGRTRDFAGWVYPDGSAFSAADFPAAAAEYGAAGGSFNVPNLQDSFFRGSSSSM